MKPINNLSLYVILISLLSSDFLYSKEEFAENPLNEISKQYFLEVFNYEQNIFNNLPEALLGHENVLFRCADAFVGLDQLGDENPGCLVENVHCALDLLLGDDLLFELVADRVLEKGLLPDLVLLVLDLVLDNILDLRFDLGISAVAEVLIDLAQLWLDLPLKHLIHNLLHRLELDLLFAVFPETTEHILLVNHL